MADIAHELTDRELEKMERHLSAIYARAEKEIGETWKNYLAEIDREIKPLQDAYDAAKKSGDAEAIRKAGRKLSAKKREKTIMDGHYKAMTEQFAQELSNVNQTAAAYINGKLPSVYATNYNLASEGIAGEVKGYSFELVDASTVKNLATTDKTLLPYKYVDGKKDVRWNTTKVNSEVLQGIIQGESIPKIAKRLQNVTEMNRASAIRNARTTVTSAENKGRMDSLHRAAEKGVIAHKVWMAAIDARTREAHRLLDGQEQDIDDPFKSELGDIMYPGDPDADPANVYNCRCTLTYKVVGFERQEVENEFMAETNVVNGEDISQTWKRRADRFDFEIEDIINAQGFDGVPRVVSQEEFNEAVKAANGGDGFIAQRTYSAPDQETLDAYRDQLYDGKWYVDCSTGGSQYGQGMYCAADYNGKLTDGIKAEMEHYQSIGAARTMGYSYTETLTIDPSAKVITYDKANEMLMKYQSEIFEKISRGEITMDYAKENTIRDVGSYAASLGYDAINAEGHGESGSYTVILNRTKLIILGEG